MSRQLVAICEGSVPEPPASPGAATDLVTAVRFHRIAPLAHVAYREVYPPLGAGLRPDRDLAVGTHLRATMLLEDVGALLDDIPWVTFKGAVLSETAHPRPGLRSYNDVDLLVSPGDLRRACASLTDAGWQIADYDDMLRNPETPGEMHWLGPGGLGVDLHWSMTNTAVRRARLSVDTADLLQRRRQIALGLTSTWTLHAVDSLVHVALHATLSGANRLVYLLDVDQLARQVTDWSAIVGRAREWQAGPHLFLVLARARRALGTPVPDDLASQLGLSAAFSRICAVIDERAPVPAGRRDPGLARLVARAVRPGALRTTASVARSVAIGAAERVVGTRRSAPRVRTRADQDALSLYLDAVESAGCT